MSSAKNHTEALAQPGAPSEANKARDAALANAGASEALQGPLWAAVMAGDAEAAAEWLAKGANPFVPVADDLLDAVSLAAQRGQEKCLRLFVEDPDFVAKTQAASRGRKETGPFAALATDGPESDAYREALLKASLTPLIRAARAGHAECVRLVLPVSDANQASFERDGSTLAPFQHAVLNGHVDCAVLLFSATAESRRKIDDEPPLHWAAKHGSAEWAEAFLALGCDPAERDADFGRTPLHVAAKASNAKVAQVLLPVSDPHARDATGAELTPLMTAAQAGSAACVAILAPVSDLIGKSAVEHPLTAIDGAIEWRKPEAVEALALSMAAKFPRQTGKALTKAVGWARRWDQWELVDAFTEVATTKQMEKALAERTSAEQAPRMAAKLESIQLAAVVEGEKKRTANGLNRKKAVSTDENALPLDAEPAPRKRL